MDYSLFSTYFFSIQQDQFDSTFDLMCGDNDFVDFESFKRHIFGSAKLREYIYILISFCKHVFCLLLVFFLMRYFVSLFKIRIV